MVGIERKRILVVGDLVLDAYTFGRVQRISPEAPVPVLLTERLEHRPGMAGNTARNLLALEQDVVLLARVGRDCGAMVAALEAEGIGTESLVVQEGWRTPVKQRLIAGQQQIARVDTEDPMPLDDALEKRILADLPRLLEGIDLCAISDYGKGFFRGGLLGPLIDACRERGIPTCLDPKGRHFDRYWGATLIKPNVSEAIHAAGLPEESSLDAVAEVILRRTGAQMLMITLSERGIAIFTERGRQDFATQASEVRDVTGAGDTVLAVVAAALASRLPIEEAAVLANRAAGEAVKHVGCTAVPLAILRGESSVEPASIA